jgi:hypothetical protein
MISVRRAIHAAIASALSVLLPPIVFGSVLVALSEETLLDLAMTLLVFSIVAVPCAMVGALLYGLPVYLLLQRLGLRTLPWSMVFGAGGGLALQVAMLGPGTTLDAWFIPVFFAAQGAGTAAAFWYVMERWRQTEE